MSCKIYKFRGKEYSETQLVSLLANDMDLVKSLRPQEQRGQDADYKAEDIDVFKDKVEALQKTLDVEVIYDDTISSSRVLGANDPRTIAAGKPVIVINPNKIFNNIKFLSCQFNDLIIWHLFNQFLHKIWTKFISK